MYHYTFEDITKMMILNNPEVFSTNTSGCIGTGIKEIAYSKIKPFVKKASNFFGSDISKDILGYYLAKDYDCASALIITSAGFYIFEESHSDPKYYEYEHVVAVCESYAPSYVGRFYFSHITFLTDSYFDNDPNSDEEYGYCMMYGILGSKIADILNSVILASKGISGDAEAESFYLSKLEKLNNPVLLEKLMVPNISDEELYRQFTDDIALYYTQKIDNYNYSENDTIANRVRSALDLAWLYEYQNTYISLHADIMSIRSYNYAIDAIADADLSINNTKNFNINELPVKEFNRDLIKLKNLIIKSLISLDDINEYFSSQDLHYLYKFVGDMYLSGPRTDINLKKAIQYFLKCYELEKHQLFNDKFADMYYYLGECYRSEIGGISYDLDKLQTLFEKSAELGYAPAEYALAQIYESKNDMLHAYSLKCKAASKGIKDDGDYEKIKQTIFGEIYAVS